MWICRAQLSDSFVAPQLIKNFCSPETATRGHPLLAIKSNNFAAKDHGIGRTVNYMPRDDNLDRELRVISPPQSKMAFPEGTSPF